MIGHTRAAACPCQGRPRLFSRVELRKDPAGSPGQATGAVTEALSAVLGRFMGLADELIRAGAKQFAGHSEPVCGRSIASSRQGRLSEPAARILRGGRTARSGSPKHQPPLVPGAAISAIPTVLQRKWLFLRSKRPPPFQMGAPPRGMVAPPREMGAPPERMGAPPRQMGPAPARNGGAPAPNGGAPGQNGGAPIPSGEAPRQLTSRIYDLSSDPSSPG